jgi:hypothetical protein
MLGRIVDAVGEDRLGQPLTDLLFTPRAPSEAHLIASRVVTVVA